MSFRTACFMLVAAPALAADLPRSAAPAGVEVYFIAPDDGAEVRSPVHVQFGLRGMGIAPAGVAIKDTGHHHLIVDAALPPLDRPIPADDHHVHFGKGQTETLLELAPGRHRLQLLLGDHLHIPHEPAVHSKPIEITVKP